MEDKHMIRGIWVAVFAGVLFLSAPVIFAQTSTPDDDVRAAIQELRAEIKSLRATVNDLHSQLETTKSQLETTRVDFEAARQVVGLAPVTETLVSQPPVFLPNVREVQAFLKNYPDVYPEGYVTGFYGDLTKKAIRKFQEKYGRNVNDPRVKGFYDLVYGEPVPRVVPAPLPYLVPTSTSPSLPVLLTTSSIATTATTTPLMQQAICPALPTVSVCRDNEERVVAYSSPSFPASFSSNASKALAPYFKMNSSGSRPMGSRRILTANPSLRHRRPALMAPSKPALSGSNSKVTCPAKRFKSFA